MTLIKFSMPCNMVRQSLSDTASLAHDAQVLAHHATAAMRLEDKAFAFFFHSLLFFVSCLSIPAMADNGFCYGMQRYDKLNLCLLTLLADIFPPIRCRLDMPVFQFFHVSDCQPCKAGKDKHQPCQFRFSVVHLHCHQFHYLALLQKAYFLFLLLIFDVLKRVTADYSLAHCPKHQSAQPTKVTVNSRCCIFTLLQEETKLLEHLLRDGSNGYILISSVLYKLREHLV